MKKHLPFLFFAMLLIAFQTVSSQVLYSNVSGTGQSYNPKFGSANTPKIVFDDIQIPNGSIETYDSVSITKLKLGIVRTKDGTAFNASVYISLVNQDATTGAGLVTIPPVLLGTYSFGANTTGSSMRDVISIGDSINSIYKFKTDTSNYFSGYQTLYVGVSFSVSTLCGWEPSAGPGYSDDVMWVYDADNSVTPMVYTWFGGTPPASFRIEMFGKGEGTVPVVLTNFDVQNVNNQNNLTWSTSQESNSSYYSIERSNNGTNFTAIGKVAAAGNSSTARLYSYTDNNPMAGINYYRLKMVDLDNSSKYSEIKSVKNTSFTSLSIYPNPVAKSMKLSITSEKADMGTITISNIAGQTVYSSQVKVEAGKTLIPINVNTLSSGTYVVKVQLSTEVFTEKFTKE